MHESLLKQSSEPFTLHVLALDMETMWLLNELQLENVQVVPLQGFEHAMNLSEIKATRTWKEFAWGCASSFLQYLLPSMDEDGITYLDADLWFTADPIVMFQELGNRSIAIIPHRLIPSKRHLEINGKFNVGWLTIRNTPTGRKCIERWAKQVRGWCFDRVEGENACGDQKFLNEWPDLYGNECCIIQNIGANTAPWNVSQYQVNVGPTVDGVPVVFYHFHEFQSESKLTNYPLRTQDIAFIYKPYVQAWTAATQRIAEAEARAYEERKVLEMEAQRA